MKLNDEYDLLVIGAGLAGIATAYYLTRSTRSPNTAIVDWRQPMSYTTAQSGDNYRNWWPHPTMTAFTNASIDLMESIARESGNALNLTRRGYLLVTRNTDIAPLVDELYAGYVGAGPEFVREHDTSSIYTPPDDDWTLAPDGVDILLGSTLIREQFPALNPDIRSALHVRRAGELSGQQLGAWMLERYRDAGGKRIRGQVVGIESDAGFSIDMRSEDGSRRIRAARIVIAAGPYVGDVASMLGIELPVSNVYQQKTAFDDRLGAVPRDLPFTIDLDAFELDWSDEEREFLAAGKETAWLTEKLTGGVHCRPEGGVTGSWVKLGWAFNGEASQPVDELAEESLRFEPFPEIVMRAAARTLPALSGYLENFPARFSHYGGYYTMTEENWPLIGPLDVDNAFVVGALSGFGSMAAAAAGELCARWVNDEPLPDYAPELCPARMDNAPLRASLLAARSKGLL